MIKSFGSFDNFTKEFNEKSVAVQGSGWGWLAMDKNGNMFYEDTAN